MILSVEVRQKLKAERGIYLTSACDACGKLLGAVRCAHRGEPGNRCSQKCRDGAEKTADGQRKGDHGSTETSANADKWSGDKLRIGNALFAFV